MAEPGGIVVASLDNSLYGLALAAAAAASATARGRFDDLRPRLRLSSSFVVTASITLPAPFGLLVAIAALASSRGAGLSVGFRSGWRPAFSGICGALAAQALGATVFPLKPLAAAAVVGTAMIGSMLLIEWLLGAPRPTPRGIAIQSANLAAAALLAGLVHQGAWPVLLCASILLVGAAHALGALHSARAEAASNHAAYALRQSELLTLHAIGREVLATVDSDRIFGIIERECRKIFDVAFFFVGVLDRDTNEIGISYRSMDDERKQALARPLANDLASFIVREKRPLRLDDASAGTEALPFSPHVVDAQIRSVLAAPLMVGERVVGVLSVQSRRASAYDDHQLSVLATIAQQAAVAVDNARHYSLETIDPVTHLLRREGFFRRIEDESARAKRYSGRFAILMLDLDAFRAINDRYGRLAGDRYLRAVGATIRSRMRGADVACRYGDDEFCILLPETDLPGARRIAERLRQVLARLVVDVEGASLRTTVSIGIAAYPEHDTGEIKGVILRADSALYQAKRAGRDCVVPFAA